MTKKLTVCACALVALLLLCSDASAQVIYSPAYYGPTYSDCAPVYGYGYAASYSYAPSYAYAPSYSYAANYGYGYAPSYSYAYAPSYGYAAGYGYGGYGYGGYGSRYYNPGGLGGPYSGLGVRPGLGLGGFGLRR
jgi:hypothetical protein